MRAAIRDVGRIKDIPLHQVDRIAKLIPGIPGKPVTIQDVLTEGNEFYNAELVDLFKKEKWVQELLETSMQLEGVARHSGIHAAARRGQTRFSPWRQRFGSAGGIASGPRCHGRLAVGHYWPPTTGHPPFPRFISGGPAASSRGVR